MTSSVLDRKFFMCGTSAAAYGSVSRKQLFEILWEYARRNASPKGGT